MPGCREGVETDLQDDAARLLQSPGSGWISSQRKPNHHDDSQSSLSPTCYPQPSFCIRVPSPRTPWTLGPLIVGSERSFTADLHRQRLHILHSMSATSDFRTGGPIALASGRVCELNLHWRDNCQCYSIE